MDVKNGQNVGSKETSKKESFFSKFFSKKTGK